MQGKRNVEELVSDFFDFLAQPLAYDEFINEVQERYWLPGKQWMADLIPWNEMKQYKMKPNKIHMLSDDMGLLSVSFEFIPNVFTSLSLVKEGDRWFLDWQNREVWLLATRQWKKKTENNLEIRFANSFAEEEIDLISEELQKINQWILEEFGADQEKLVIILGFDSLEYKISGTNHKPSSKGGSSRGKLILMSEGLPSFRTKTFESVYFESVLLHEMIHEYSCYDKLWNGSISDPSLKLALINEGVAFYYQFKYFTEKIKSMDYNNDNPQIIRIIKGIEEALNYNSSIFELICNQKFNDFNQINPEAGNPAYFLAASLYAYFLEKLGFEKIREIYSQAGKKDSKKAKDILTKHLHEEEYLAYSKTYLKSILYQFSPSNRS